MHIIIIIVIIIISDCKVAVQDTLNEQEGTASVFNEPQSVREERTPPLDLHPVDQRYFAVLCCKGLKINVCCCNCTTKVE